MSILVYFFTLFFFVRYYYTNIVRGVGFIRVYKMKFYKTDF